MSGERQADLRQRIVPPDDASLVAMPSLDENRELATSVIDKDAADAATMDSMVQAALALAGAWSDLSWEEFEAELYRIRHESEPTLPIVL